MQQILELQEMELEHGGHAEELVQPNSAMSITSCGSDFSVIVC